MANSKELLIDFRATRNVLKATEQRYNQIKRDICKAYDIAYDAFMSDADIIEMLLSSEPKEGA